MDCIMLSKSTKKKAGIWIRLYKQILVATRTLGENHFSLMYSMDSGSAITLMN